MRRGPMRPLGRQGGRTRAPTATHSAVTLGRPDVAATTARRPAGCVDRVCCIVDKRDRLRPADQGDQIACASSVNAAATRSAGRAERVILATLAKLMAGDRWRIFLVSQSTLLRWHREPICGWWTYPANGRGRRPLDVEVVDLVLRLARPSAVARSVGVLLGRVSRHSVEAAMRLRGRPRWRRGRR